MSSNSKSLERKLDRDFLGYLSLTKTLFDNVSSEDEKRLCEAWLKQLCGKCITTIKGKRYRNIYLFRLLLQMQDGKLKDIFLTAPPAGDLESPYTVFGLPMEVADVKGIQKMGFQMDNETGGGSGDVSEFSRDGRTYLATRQIKNGMMAYLAVTNTDDEPLWIPQQNRQTFQTAEEGNGRKSSPGYGRFIKRLAQVECTPLSQIRKSPEEREQVLEWIDNIIDGCNKWLRGEDPHNMDLELLFQHKYEQYEKDPQKAEILKYPKDVRDVLMRDIRDLMTERRAQVSRRELILDQYEADEYVEEKLPKQELNVVWHQSARKPMIEHVRKNLERTYPPEVVQRFFQLLVQERILIIEKGERDVYKKLAAMRNSNMEDVKKELRKIEKVKQEYKEYYSIYKEVENHKAEYKNLMKEVSTGKAEKTVRKGDMARMKNELEEEIEKYRRRYEKERKTQGELVQKLEDVKEAYSKQKDIMRDKEEKQRCERDNILMEQEKLKASIKAQKIKLCDLRNLARAKHQSVYI